MIKIVTMINIIAKTKIKLKKKFICSVSVMGSNPSKNYSQNNEIESYNISSYPFFTQICAECKKNGIFYTTQNNQIQNGLCNFHQKNIFCNEI